jgi:hypothetical protein
MAKKKPSIIFRIDCRNGKDPIYVIARHTKGAKAVAKNCGMTLPRNPIISEVSDEYKFQALNYEAT